MKNRTATSTFNHLIFILTILGVDHLAWNGALGSEEFKAIRGQ